MYVLDICAFLGFTQRRVVIHYRRCWTTYRPHLQGSRNPTLEDGTDRFSRNVGKGLPLETA
jgi:hypothetical protein